MNRLILFLPLVVLAFVFYACHESIENDFTLIGNNPLAGQTAINAAESQLNVVQLVNSSKEQTTFAKAIKAAELVDVLSDDGPFTLFVPVNAAFDKLPAGTVSNLLQLENKTKLQELLHYHVTNSSLNLNFFKDGQRIGMLNGVNIEVHLKNNKVYINDAQIIASIPAVNGIVHVIDGVLIPSK